MGLAHQLRDGLTEETARTALLLATQTARGCGLKIALNADERKLIRRYFEVQERISTDLEDRL